MRRLHDPTPPRTLAAVRLDATTEKDFQQTVIEYARLMGWRTYHTFDSRRSTSGWPDVVLCRPPRLIIAEIKTETGRVSEAQKEWLAELAKCPGVEVVLWRPSHWAAIEVMME